MVTCVENWMLAFIFHWRPLCLTESIQFHIVSCYSLLAPLWVIPIMCALANLTSNYPYGLLICPWKSPYLVIDHSMWNSFRHCQVSLSFMLWIRKVFITPLIVFPSTFGVTPYFLPNVGFKDSSLSWFQQVFPYRLQHLYSRVLA
jgi:hypothetical protein